MRIVVVVVCLLVVAAGGMAAPGRVPVPNPGVLAQTILFPCGGESVELRLYDFDPEHETEWKSRALALPGRRNFLQATQERPGDAQAGRDLVYIDFDQDGFADEVILTLRAAVEKYGATVCEVFENIIRKRRA